MARTHRRWYIICDRTAAPQINIFMKLSRKVLYNRARPTDFDFPVRNKMLVDEMVALMLRENGIGLAAPQIGISRRLFVMCVDGNHRHCFNPEIVESSEQIVEFNEGCLSFPGDQCIIKRPDWVRVSYQDHTGAVIETQLFGLESRCFQHELDHLDGITMWQRYKEQHAEQSRN
jgi:peptide deformylase